MQNTLLQIPQFGMGTGSQELGIKLALNYLNLINKEELLPKFIILYNSGVKLICTNSPAIDILKTIEKAGTKIIACKTCLNHYNLIDKIEVGITGSMIDIIELQSIVDKIITI